MNPTSKSIIGYPGGKSKAAQMICSFIPAGTERILSPFFGGGSVEFLAASRGIEVFGHDAFEPLVNFWQHCKHWPQELEAEVRQILNYAPMDEDRFKMLKSEYAEIRKPISQAATFFILNQFSFGSYTLSGTFHHTKTLAESKLRALGSYSAPNVYVSHGDYRSTIPAAYDDLIYADPPYMGVERKFYGFDGDHHRGFDHAEFHDTITKEKNWIVSLDDCAATRRLFDGFHMETPKWKYSIKATVKKASESNELLIFSDAVWARHTNESLLAYCEAK